MIIIVLLKMMLLLPMVKRLFSMVVRMVPQLVGVQHQIIRI